MSSYNIKLPNVIHKTIDNVFDKRIIVIGDIHGCFDEFMLLLNKLEYNDKKDLLILVGDLVMKGPKSLEVIQYCCKNNILSVTGNVDQNSLKNYENLKNNFDNDWKIYEWMKKLTSEELEYMYQLPYTISLPEYNSIIVHAGLMPYIKLDKQRYDMMIRMRSVRVTQNEYLFTVDNVGDSWITKWHGPQHVYFGHAAQRGLQISEFATGLDTACCYGKQLTCCILNTNEIVSISALKSYVNSDD